MGIKLQELNVAGKRKESKHPKVLKLKNDVPTVIEWNGNRYVLDHDTHFKPQRK